MCKLNYTVARILISVAISGLLFSVTGAEVKPDKKKSQAAYQTGTAADQAGNRDQAIAAYTEAIEADAETLPRCARGAKTISRPATGKRPPRISKRPSGSQPSDAKAISRAASSSPKPVSRSAPRRISLPRSALKLERSEVYSGRGFAYLATGNTTRPSRTSRKPSSSGSTTPSHIKAAAWRCAALGKYRDAIEDFDSALTHKPDYEEALVERALAYTGLADFAHAEQDLTAALKLNADDVRAWRVRGAVRERLPNYAGAIADYDEAIQRDPRDARLYLARGAVYARHWEIPGISR